MIAVHLVLLTVDDYIKWSSVILYSPAFFYMPGKISPTLLLDSVFYKPWNNFLLKLCVMLHESCAQGIIFGNNRAVQPQRYNCEEKRGV